MQVTFSRNKRQRYRDDPELIAKWEGKIAFAARDGNQPDGYGQWEVLEARLSKSGKVYFLKLGKKILPSVEKNGEIIYSDLCYERVKQQFDLECKRSSVGDFLALCQGELVSASFTHYPTNICRQFCLDGPRYMYDEFWRFVVEEFARVGLSDRWGSPNNWLVWHTYPSTGTKYLEDNIAVLTDDVLACLIRGVERYNQENPPSDAAFALRYSVKEGENGYY